MDRRVDGNTVTYTYHLHEYKGPDGCLSSDEVIQSSSTCTGRVISLGIDYLENETRWIMPVNVFENGKRVATYIACKLVGDVFVGGDSMLTVYYQQPHPPLTRSTP